MRQYVGAKNSRNTSLYVHEQLPFDMFSIPQERKGDHARQYVDALKICTICTIRCLSYAARL